jgi:hypothetical protein
MIKIIDNYSCSLVIMILDVHPMTIDDDDNDDGC